MQTLPIDAHLPGIVARLRQRGTLVLVADPGAGKTTRVPRALLDAGLDEDGEIVVVEPRRLAARLAARRVAEELDEDVGGRVGHEVRFDRAVSDRTRVRFVTEGILARRLVADPALRGVGTVLLDEFHERHLQGDLALALLHRLRRTERPELRLGAMSATLETEPLARFLDADLVSVPGRLFPVAVEHLERGSLEPTARPAEVAAAVARALRRLATDPGDRLDGDVLVFLPGAAEIRAALEGCRRLADAANFDLVPLHGDLPAAEQDRAVRRGPRPKAILSTNVAETSITIEGVAAVVDTGLARQARHSPWSGLPSLDTVRISRASAAQRAGRAGRTRPGRCLRLYTAADHDRRPAHDVPEVLRADLAETVLALAASVPDPAALPWLDPPPPAALQAATTLLGRLGAIDGDGRLLDAGRAMLALPLHPRLGRLVLTAADLGAAARGCLAAALLGERDVRLGARTATGGRRGGRSPDPVAGPSDLLDRVEAFEAAGGRGGRDKGLDRGALQAVSRAREQVAQALERARGGRARMGGAAARAGRAAPSSDEALLRATLAAFPDRVGRRRKRGGDEIVLAEGGSARLGDLSVVRDAEWLVAVEVDERSARRRAGDPAAPLVRVASAIEAEWLIDLFPERVVERREVRFDGRAERVECSSALGYGRLVLHESREAPTEEEAHAVLSEAARAAGPEAFCDGEALATWRARVELAAGLAPGLPVADDDAVREALGDLCRGRRSFAELRAAPGGGLIGALRGRLTGAQRAAVERLAPERVELRRGRKVKVVYEPGRAPWIGSRLQDFFGMGDGPRIGGGKVPLVLHLLAPSRRPVQVTTDLAGFWRRHYPSIRRELRRRYPKHAWPEDPGSAPD